MRYSRQLRHLDWMLARPIAHRGLHNVSLGVIENTASAFAAAMARNYAVECDLRLAGDGEAVVFHDATLDRLTPEGGKVITRSTRELKQVPISGSGDRIQTLSELLDQVDGRVALVIELKTHWDGDLRLAVRAVEILAGYTGPYALMSFDPDLVQAVAELNPGTVRGIVADRFADGYYSSLPFARRLGLRELSHVERTLPHFVSYHFSDLPFAPVQRIRNAGFPVIAWTTRSRAEESQARRYCDQVTFEGYIA